jgi:putative acetyltransferase
MLSVHREIAEHAKAVRQINELAFGTSAEAELVVALRRDRAVTLALVAQEQADIVGHILFSPGDRQFKRPPLGNSRV